MFERERESAVLSGALDAAFESSARLVSIEGAAGAGKSALLDALQRLAEDRGAQVLTARGGLLEREAGFGVARQLFEAPLARASDAQRAELLEGAAALAIPALNLGGESPGLPLDELQSRHGLYWLTANLAERGPLVLLIDDLQWCDRATLEWLLYLERRIERTQVLLVTTTRLGEPDAPRDLLEALRAEPIATVLELAALSVAGTSALLESVFEIVPGAEFAAECHAWTGGNPHYISELAVELSAEGIAPDGSAIERMRQIGSSGTSAVTMLRISRLSDDAVAFARALAVLGESAEPHHIAELAGLSETVGVAANDALVEALICAPGQPVRFIHPLVAAVIVEDLPAATRAAEHKRAAQILYADGADADHVGSQLLFATVAHDPWVVDRLREAAQPHLAAGSPGSAARFLRRAMSERPEQPLAGEISWLLGMAQAASGDPDGLTTLSEALDAAGDDVERAAIAATLGRFLLLAGRGRDAVEMIDATLQRLDGVDPRLRVELETTLIGAARSDRDLVALAQQRLAQLESLAPEDSPSGRRIAVSRAYAETAAGGSAAAAIAQARAALGGGRLLAEAPLSPDVYLVPISMLAICDQLAEANGHYSQALESARSRGSSVAYAATAAMQSWAMYLTGALGESELLGRDALRIAAESPALLPVAGFATAHLTAALVDRGEVDAALALYSAPPSLEDSQHTWSRDTWFAYGTALLAAGRAAEAAPYFLQCGRASEQFGIENPAFLPWRSHAALALREDPERALGLCDQEVAAARRFGAARPLGIALRAAGLIRGGEAGVELLRESVEVLLESPAELELARSQVELGAALRRSGSRADARDHLAAGQSTAERLGAAPLAAYARAELGASGARPRGDGRWDADALTVSELRVCEMAASGMSNPGIAQALFVTRGTIESHLHTAYRKLEISSRAELPDALARHAEG